MMETKAFRTIIRVYSLLKNELLSVNIKSTLHKALIRTIMTCLPHLGICGNKDLMKLQRLQNRVLCTLAIFQGSHRLAIFFYLKFESAIRIYIL
jgi:hypothetical protein